MLLVMAPAVELAASTLVQKFRPGRCSTGEWQMTFGVGNLVALICIVISIIFAIVTHQATNALWWALLAIFAVLWWDARAPWGRP